MVMAKSYNFSNLQVNNFRFLTYDNQGYKLVFMNMADRIKQRMLELDIKQEDLGKAVGLTQPAIFKLLSGKTKRTTRLTEIAKALKVSPEWLVEGTEPMLPGATDNDQDIAEMVTLLKSLPISQRQSLKSLDFPRETPAFRPERDSGSPARATSFGLRC